MHDIIGGRAPEGILEQNIVIGEKNLHITEDQQTL